MLTDMNQLPHSGTQRYSFPSYLFIYSMLYALFCQYQQNSKHLSFSSDYAAILEIFYIKKATRYANTKWHAYLCKLLLTAICPRKLYCIMCSSTLQQMLFLYPKIGGTYGKG